MTPQSSTKLTGKQRSYLRSLAHPLKPIVQIGHGGLTEAVLIAIDGALLVHELVKIKVTGNEEVSAAQIAPEVEQRTRSSVAQVIGKTLVLYRARKKDPAIILPQADGTPGKLKSPTKTSKPSTGARPPKSTTSRTGAKLPSKFVKPSKFGKRG